MAVGLALLASALPASTTIEIPQLPKGADSLFPFTRSAKTSFIDRTGRVVIQPKFTRVGYFFAGLASFEKEKK